MPELVRPTRYGGFVLLGIMGNANGTPLGLSNFSVFPNNLANQWHGNQYYLVVENPLEPDDMVNLGFRVDTLFGNDWQFTRDYGLFTGAFTQNQFAGLDLPQIYGEIHLPIMTPGGLEIKGGRFYSQAGFSAVPAISRPFITVPYIRLHRDDPAQRQRSAGAGQPLLREPFLTVVAK